MAKRKYNSWQQEDMEKALNEYNSGHLKFNEACRVYRIPKPTFRRHLKGLNVHKRIGHPNDLTKEMEDELVRHILDLESRFFGLTIHDLRGLAFQLAEKHKLPHRFNKDTKLAGWKWYYNFLKKHPQITLRTPEPTSIARCKGFNKKTVLEFFDKYESLLDEGKFSAHQIYNVDETGLSTVHKPMKVLAQKGKHQIGAVTSGERGVNTTCICCMNAAGEFIPPMLIFKRKRMTDDLKRGGLPNTLYSCSDSGWITSELFLEWLKHFINCTRLEKSNKKQILLILDGHATHTKNLDAINLARDFGIVMLSLPPHTTHKLQPLDRSFFKPLKQHFNTASATWLRNNPDSVIKQRNISEILGVAYPRAVCMETAMHGFEACGLWPCNRFKIRDDEYVTLDENGENQEVGTSTNSPVPTTNKLAPSISSPVPATEKPYVDQIQDNRDLCYSPLGSSEIMLLDEEDREQVNIENEPNNNKENTSLEKIRLDIQSISPMCTLQQSKRNVRKTTKTQVLTESPYKNELERKLNETKKAACKNFEKQKVIKRKNDNEKKKSQNGNKKKKIKRTNQENEDKNWYCKMCKENKEENMIQCNQCECWVHDLCAGVDKNVVNYFCDDCKELGKTIRRACQN